MSKINNKEAREVEAIIKLADNIYNKMHKQDNKEEQSELFLSQAVEALTGIKCYGYLEGAIFV